MTSVLTPIALVLVVLTPTLTLIGALNAAMLRSGRRSVLPIKLPFYGAGASLFFGAGAVLLAALLQSRVDAIAMYLPSLTLFMLGLWSFIAGLQYWRSGNNGV